VARGTIHRTHRRAVVALLVARALAPSAARGSAAELFGLGSEQAALVGAASARVRDFSSGYYNPAGLANLRSAEVSLGLLGFGSRLVASTSVDTVLPISQPVGILVGAAAPVPLGAVLARRLFVGVALYVLPATLAEVIARAPSEPFFPYYDDRAQRLLVLPSLAVRIAGGLSAGIGLDYLAGVAGRVASAPGATRATEARVDEQIQSVLAVHAGLQWRSPGDRFGAAIVYRQRFSVPFSTVSNNSVAGQGLDLAIAAEGLFTPDELVFGGSARPVRWLELSADLTASFWSEWRGPFVAVDSSLPIAGSLTAPPPTLRYEDTVSLRVGAEASRRLAPSLVGKLRAGYGVESSPIPEQPGVTNLLDGTKHFLGVGAGLRWERGRFALRVDGHAQLHLLQPRTFTKEVAPPGSSPDPASALRDEQPAQPGVQIANPGWPSITGSGFVWSAGFTFTVER